VKRAPLYARVSTGDQNCDTQLLDLRQLAEQRGLSDGELGDQHRGGETEGTLDFHDGDLSFPL